jgi:hypothetical protein
MKLFFIRQKSTGLYIQQAYGPKGKGGSWLEPGPEDNARPFMSLRATRGFMSNWLKGTVEGDRYEGDYKVTPVPTRRAEDFEIIEKEINLDASSSVIHPASSPVPAQYISHRR